MQISLAIDNKTNEMCFTFSSILKFPFCGDKSIIKISKIRVVLNNHLLFYHQQTLQLNNIKL